MIKIALFALTLAVIFATVSTGGDNRRCFRQTEKNHSQTVAEMVCCHCYKRMSDGTRFYMGVREVESCLSYSGGYCVGYAKCFP